jgi:hypothetical protein
MTGAPKKEYIITRSQLAEFERYYPDVILEPDGTTVTKMGNVVRSRPATPSAEVLEELIGCQYGCLYHIHYGTMSPEYCGHPSFPKAKKIIGYSSKSCEIPEGKIYPDWCPIKSELQQQERER